MKPDPPPARDQHKPKLLDQVRSAIRARHFSIRTEEAYVQWIRRFILFHNKRHPREMGTPEINAFLFHLASKKNVASSTQNGFSRPAYYQAQSQFKEAGLTGFIRARPGPKSAHKLTAEIMDFVEEEVRKSARIRARKLALLVKERFGIKIHPRSIERALAREGKKSKPAV